MKNKLGFVGSILGTCLTALGTIIMLLAFVVLLDILAAAGITSPLALILMIFEILVFIVSLVLNIMSIVATSNIGKMNNKKGLIISTIVFNFISAGLMIYAIVNQFSILNFLIALGLIASSILLIIGLKNLKTEIAQLEASKQPVETNEVKETEQVIAE